uniref:Immunoglobulin domain-containing protein n=2 Tax=Cyprinus carpio carpio TaxID=630221 RepID=A0A8C1A0Y3_CYPCA
MFHMFVLFCLCWQRLICVFGSESNEIQSVSVMEGESVTLNTDVTEIHKHDDILWKYGAEKSLIAKINQETGNSSTYDVPDGRFRDRLKLDDQTGSLTITNITTQHAGLYEVKIAAAKLSSKTFIVSVYEVHTHLCGSTEAVIRLVVSALVGIATVAVLVYDIRSRR